MKEPNQYPPPPPLAPPPGREEILSAALRIKPYINRTPVITCSSLNTITGASLFFKCENFQKVGAFKARGATNAIRMLSGEQAPKGVCTHSSGNHAQALAWAAGLAGFPAHIVMPSNSSRVKVDAVKGYGGRITFCEPNLRSREETLEKVQMDTGATEIHPYNNYNIIAGQATAALELLGDAGDLDVILTPVGGGGLLSGTALACHFFSPDTRVVAAEPLQANDAWQSFHQKKFIPSVNPETIADGLRTSLGSLTFPLILKHVSDIITVKEETIVAAMRLIWERMKIVVEPSAAAVLAALIEQKESFSGLKAGLILSGGNVDLDHLPWGKVSHG